jgi:hypothetical protein
VRAIDQLGGGGTWTRANRWMRRSAVWDTRPL